MNFISAMTDKDLKEALNLGLLNFDSLKPEAKPALKRKLQHMSIEVERRGLVKGPKVLAFRRMVDGLKDSL
jgi:hypothetical protein